MTNEEIERVARELEGKHVELVMHFDGRSEGDPPVDITRQGVLMLIDDNREFAVIETELTVESWPVQNIVTIERR